MGERTCDSPSLNLPSSTAGTCPYGLMAKKGSCLCAPDMMSTASSPPTPASMAIIAAPVQLLESGTPKILGFPLLIPVAWAIFGHSGALVGVEAAFGTGGFDGPDSGAAG